MIAVFGKAMKRITPRLEKQYYAVLATCEPPRSVILKRYFKKATEAEEYGRRAVEKINAQNTLLPEEV